MKYRVFYKYILCCFFSTCLMLRSSSHDVFFCGERIPIDDRLVAEKMMNIIKKQINYLNIASLKQNIATYMARVEYYLELTNIPKDFKYLAIVESGFKTDATSPVGAVGFWQLMPQTARGYDLVVNEVVDERKDFEKSTQAACRTIADNYLSIRKTFGLSSWVLTAAAYNYGVTRIRKEINKQGNDYFSMSLNPETAAYVYKIIAVKELFEYPELYMKNFGYNIFNTSGNAKTNKVFTATETDISAFGSMKVDINEKDGQHPLELKKGSIKKMAADNLDKIKLISAKIKGKYKNFKDGETITLELEGDLQVKNFFTAKGQDIQGTGWIIDKRVMVDLGYNHVVTLYDLKNEKGLSLSRLKKNEPVILKVIK